ncbi:MAG TPA: hypothetical protein DCW29_19590 [Janthinobacterium sp.]|nr:hypothetical protein [Janthinobacterium sp.]
MRSWWILALRGAIALLFGIFALAMPGLTLFSLIAIFAIYALLVGAVSVIGALRNWRSEGWWALLLLGLVSLAAGVLATMRPTLTALALVIVIGVNALVTGALDIFLAAKLRHVMRDEWLLILSAVVSIAFGALIIAYPGAGALALVWLIGVYALLTGVLYLVLAFRANSKRRLTPVAPDGRPRLERRTGERRMTAAGH